MAMPPRIRFSFQLDLGPQVVAVVPQPISRNAQGALTQARNQIQVYFNNDDLLKESDGLGRPLADLRGESRVLSTDFHQRHGAKHG